MNDKSMLRKSPQTSTDAKPEKPEKQEKPRAKVSGTKTLRDEFAMAALEHATSVYTKMTVTELDRMMGRKNYSKDEAVARLAYNMADALLSAREV
ncbi:hypothetical protein [Brevundimonas sp.]|uniref:hypothetical protein n=2 Tax=unclassified Brevundimonas TaxID=2622653 RepID=UPI00289CCEF0|nr:hypothetical protein [Brevundimonas sp.]